MFEHIDLDNFPNVPMDVAKDWATWSPVFNEGALVAARTLLEIMEKIRDEYKTTEPDIPLTSPQVQAASWWGLAGICLSQKAVALAIEHAPAGITDPTGQVHFVTGVAFEYSRDAITASEMMTQYIPDVTTYGWLDSVVTVLEANLAWAETEYGAKLAAEIPDDLGSLGDEPRSDEP